jgi:hypothetical protein
MSGICTCASKGPAGGAGEQCTCHVASAAGGRIPLAPAPAFASSSYGSSPAGDFVMSTRASTPSSSPAVAAVGGNSIDINQRVNWNIAAIREVIASSVPVASASSSSSGKRRGRSTGSSSSRERVPAAARAKSVPPKFTKDSLLKVNVTNKCLLTYELGEVVQGIPEEVEEPLTAVAGSANGAASSGGGSSPAASASASASSSAAALNATFLSNFQSAVSNIDRDLNAAELIEIFTSLLCNGNLDDRIYCDIVHDAGKKLFNESYFFDFLSGLAKRTTTTNNADRFNSFISSIQAKHFQEKLLGGLRRITGVTMDSYPTIARSEGQTFAEALRRNGFFSTDEPLCLMYDAASGPQIQVEFPGCIYLDTAATRADGGSKIGPKKLREASITYQDLSITPCVVRYFIPGYKYVISVEGNLSKVQIFHSSDTWPSTTVAGGSSPTSSSSAAAGRSPPTSSSSAAEELLLTVTVMGGGFSINSITKKLLGYNARGDESREPVDIQILGIDGLPRISSLSPVEKSLVLLIKPLTDYAQIYVARQLYEKDIKTVFITNDRFALIIAAMMKLPFVYYAGPDDEKMYICNEKVITLTPAEYNNIARNICDKLPTTESLRAEINGFYKAQRDKYTSILRQTPFIPIFLAAGKILTELISSEETALRRLDQFISDCSGNFSCPPSITGASANETTMTTPSATTPPTSTPAVTYTENQIQLLKRYRFISSPSFFYNKSIANTLPSYFQKYSKTFVSILGASTNDLVEYRTPDSELFTTTVNEFIYQLEEIRSGIEYVSGHGVTIQKLALILVGLTHQKHLDSLTQIRASAKELPAPPIDDIKFWRDNAVHLCNELIEILSRSGGGIKRGAKGKISYGEITNGESRELLKQQLIEISNKLSYELNVYTIIRFIDSFIKKIAPPPRETTNTGKTKTAPANFDHISLSDEANKLKDILKILRITLGSTPSNYLLVRGPLISRMRQILALKDLLKSQTGPDITEKFANVVPILSLLTLLEDPASVGECSASIGGGSSSSSAIEIHPIPYPCYFSYSPIIRFPVRAPVAGSTTESTVPSASAPAPVAGSSSGSTVPSASAPQRGGFRQRGGAIGKENEEYREYLLDISHQDLINYLAYERDLLTAEYSSAPTKTSVNKSAYSLIESLKKPSQTDQIKYMFMLYDLLDAFRNDAQETGGYDEDLLYLSALAPFRLFLDNVVDKVLKPPVYDYFNSNSENSTSEEGSNSENINLEEGSNSENSYSNNNYEGAITTYPAIDPVVEIFPQFVHYLVTDKMINKYFANLIPYASLSAIYGNLHSMLSELFSSPVEVATATPATLAVAKTPVKAGGATSGGGGSTVSRMSTVLAAGPSGMMTPFRPPAAQPFMQLTGLPISVAGGSTPSAGTRTPPSGISTVLFGTPTTNGSRSPIAQGEAAAERVWGATQVVESGSQLSTLKEENSNNSELGGGYRRKSHRRKSHRRKQTRRRFAIRRKKQTRRCRRQHKNDMPIAE